MDYFISSGDTIDGITLVHDFMSVLDGGLAINTTINDSGYLLVNSGGTTDNTVINSGGTFVVLTDGAANSITVNDGGEFYVEFGGTATSVTLNPGGTLFVSSGGTATDIVWTPCEGNIYHEAGATVTFGSNYSGVYYGSDGNLLSHTDMMEEKNVDCGCQMVVMDGGVANKTTVDQEGGRLDVYTGGTVNSTIINSGGYTWFHSGGVGNNTTVNSDGRVVILNGGYMKDTTVTEGGGVDIEKDGVADRTTLNGGYLTAWSGGTANNTTVNSGGWFDTYDGTANDTVVNSGGSMGVTHYGTASGATINRGGTLRIDSLGSANGIVENGGFVKIDKGADVTFAVNTFSGLILSKTSATLHSGTTAKGVTLEESGSLNIYAGGVATGIVINPGGYIYVASGGTVVNILMNAVADGERVGTIQISSGGKLTGRMICLGGTISAYNGAFIDFDLTELLPGAAARINNLSRIQGTPTYTISVKADQAEGIYALADGAYTFNQSIKVASASGEQLGMLSVGETISISGITYTLNLSDNSLSLTIGDKNTPSPYTSNGLIVSSGTESVQAGEVFYDTLVLSAAELAVADGGTANKTTIYRNGRMTVASGGTATDISASARSYLGFAVAQNTDIAGTSDGSAFVIKDGMVSNYTVNYGHLQVHAGGTANKTTVNSGGNLYVSSGGTATEIIENGGYVSVADGADVTFVHNILSGFSLYTPATIHSGTTAISNTINQQGRLYISSGGIADSTTVNSNGWLCVSSGGEATNIIASNGASLAFDVAPDTNIQGTSDGSAFEIKDAFISGFAINGGRLSVFSGGAADRTTVNSNGRLSVSNGGTANSTTVNSRGELYVYDGGTANITTVNQGGSLTVSSGGTATEIIENGGYVTVADGADVSFVQTILDGLTIRAAATIHSGTTANNATLTGKLYISSGGIANSTTIDGGIMYISSNGIANYTTINQNGGVIGMSVCSGGTANSTIVLSGARVNVTSGGIANNVLVFRTGTIVIQAGGTVNSLVLSNSDIDYYPDRCGCIINDRGIVNNTLVDSWCSMFVAGGTANDTIVNIGQMFVSRGGYASGIKLYGREDRAEGDVYVSYGGITEDATVEAYGDFYVSSGGTAKNTIINSTGNMEVSSGGIVLHTSVNGGNLYVSNGGKADNTAINDGGQITVLSGGTATGVVENGGFVHVETGAEVSYESHLFSGMTITSMATMHSGTTATNTKISGGNLQVYSSGIANSTTIYGNGSLTVMSGGIIDSVKTYAGGELCISRGGILTGKMNFLAGAVFLVESGAVVNFDLTRVSAGEKSILNDWSLVQGMPDCTITVKDNQEIGVYRLADEADDFDGTITIQNSVGESLGTLALDQTVAIGDTDYTLTVDDGILSVTVGTIGPVVPSSPTGLRAFVDGQDVAFIWSLDDLSKIKEFIVKYTLEGQTFSVTTNGTNYVLNNADFGSYSWSVQAVDFAGNESAIIAGDAFTVSGFKPYTVEYSADNFEHVIRFTVSSPTLDSFRMPTGIYQLRVMQEGSSEWVTGDSFVAAEFDDTPQLIKSDADGNADVFFANAVGAWEAGYMAQHVGSINDWNGTNEYASVYGKNKLADIIEGSTDANILLMSDDDNGDALFVDDIYTALPGSVPEQQSRIAQIDEIRAGAGADIVDMTSQQFEYIGEGLTIYGGDGNDTIWANKGDNWLFGDAGNDRIVGSSGNDVIVGGIGNDRMHGGGGNDVFTFCENWGIDTVEQLETGMVTLWFASGSIDNWDEAKLTYTDGNNSVIVSGVTVDKITLKFGDDKSEQFVTLASADAFAEFTSQKIFEESGKGILPSKSY